MDQIHVTGLQLLLLGGLILGYLVIHAFHQRKKRVCLTVMRKSIFYIQYVYDGLYRSTCLLSVGRLTGYRGQRPYGTYTMHEHLFRKDMKRYRDCYTCS